MLSSSLLPVTGSRQGVTHRTACCKFAKTDSLRETKDVEKGGQAGRQAGRPAQLAQLANWAENNRLLQEDI